MVGNVEIVAKEVIKPSSPTPLHHRHLKLSILDQLAPPVYLPLIFFYEASQLHGDNCNHAQLSIMLKKSLSNALTVFYPLAGRITEGFSVECNDGGALYVEARVHRRLMQVVENPNMDELREYLPIERKGQEGGNKEEDNVLLAIQINLFECEGIAIGVEMSHKIGDATSLVTFVSEWAATCRGDQEILEPSFEMASLFPPRDLYRSDIKPRPWIPKERIVTKHFLFSKESIAKLKELIASAPEAKVRDPTRVEAVTAFIWRNLMEIHKAKKGIKSTFRACHAVNLRRRMHPTLPDYTFGNIYSLAIAMSEGEQSGYHNLADQLRSAIRSKDDVNSIREVEYTINTRKSRSEMISKGELDQNCAFSSWCRFPVYEVDYGWGKPVWVCTTTLPLKNIVILMSNRSGDSIEAWINMPEDDAIVFPIEQMDRLF